MTRPWDAVARDFHERVKAGCWDSLAARLALLHEPLIHDGQPVCTGCDRERADHGSTDPAWPCRTYTIIAASVLDLSDVEATLNAILGITAPPTGMPAADGARGKIGRPAR